MNITSKFQNLWLLDGRVISYKEWQTIKKDNEWTYRVLRSDECNHKCYDITYVLANILRNPDIAQICFIRKYIEMLGSGTLRIIKDCKKNKFKPPVWSENDNVLKLAFPGVFHSKKYEGVNEGVNEGVKLNIERVNEGVKLELISILNALNNQPMLKVPDIASKIDKGISTVERYMKILKENNLVEFAGAPKTGGYIVKK